MYSTAKNDDLKIISIEQISTSGETTYFSVAADAQTQNVAKQCLSPLVVNASEVGRHCQQRREVLIMVNSRFVRAKMDIRPKKGFHKYLKYDCQITFYDRSGVNIRHYNRYLYEWICWNPSVIVLGLGLIDYCVYKETLATRVELDEFEIRMSWVLGKLKRETTAHIIWLYASIEKDCFDKSDKFILRSERDREYAVIVQRLCQSYDVPLIELSAVDGSFAVKPEDLYSTLAPAVNSALTDSHVAICEDIDNDRVEQIVINYSDQTRDFVTCSENIRLALARMHDYKSTETISVVRLPNSGLSLDIPSGRKPFEQSRQKQLMDWVQAEHRAKLKNAMVLGDSVFMRLQSTTGYCIPVYRHLVGAFNLTHVPHHIGGSRSVLNNISTWLETKPKVLHINCGLHDLTTLASGARFPAHVPLDEYVDNLQRIIEIVKENEVEHIIWGTCTPLNEDRYKTTIVRAMKDIRRYNEAAIEVMNRNRIEINDLYNHLIQDDGLTKNYQRDGGHLNMRGSEIIAKLVADKMLQYK